MILPASAGQSFSLQAGKGVGEGTARLAFSLGYGTSKQRYNEPPDARARLIWLTSSNRPFPETLDALQRDTAEAAMDRMITITIDKDRPYGVFDSIADGFDSAGDMAAGLVGAARANYGRPISRYLSRLTKAQAEHPKELRDYVLRYQQEFADCIAEPSTRSTSNRVAEAFGLVLAAGKLAQHFGALPKCLDCQEATKHTFELHQLSRTETRTPVERLLRLLECPDLLDLREFGRAKSKKIRRASALLWSGRDGDELLLTKEQLGKLASNPKWFLKDHSVRQAMVKEENRNQVYRYTIEGLGRERYFCFRLGILQDQGHW